MLDPADELELLSLIEGELDAHATAALRQRLSSNPQALNLVERLWQDRTVLRSTEKPRLPMDFVKRIEPLLARPMLMEPVAGFAGNENEVEEIAQPGEFRRRFRKQAHRVVWSRLAIAAVLLMGLFVGVWAAVNGLMNAIRSWSAPENRLAVAPDPANDRPTAAATKVGHGLTSPAPDRTIVQAPVDEMVVAADDGPPVLVAAEFALVVHTTNDAGAAELAVERVAAAVGGLGERAALVRNFSFVEALRLHEQWRLAQGRAANDAPPLIASTDSPVGPGSSGQSINALAERVRTRMDRMGLQDPVESHDGPLSGQIVGSKELSPTIEQQLDFSSRGAALTVAVPVRQIADLVERLSAAEGQSTALRMLPPREDDKNEIEPWQPLAIWITEGPQVREAIRLLMQSQPGAVVLIPVVVQAETPKNRK